LDRADARALLHDGANDHASLLSLLGLEADVVEQTGLPEVEEVVLQEVGVVRLTRKNAEIDADRVAGDGRVADRLEALDLLSGQFPFRPRHRRRAGGRLVQRGFGDPAARRVVDDGAGFRTLRRLL